MAGQRRPAAWWDASVSSQRCPAILEALAAWLRHVRGDARPVDDPMAEELRALWRSEGRGGVAAALFGERGLFARYWLADEATLAELTERLA